MYCTVKDVEKMIYQPLLVQMKAQIDVDPEQDWDTFIQGHIFDADTEINIELAHLFTIPFDPVPEAIQLVSKSFASYYAVAVFSEKENMSADRFKRANAIMEQIKETGMIPGIATAQKKGKIRSGSADQAFTDEVVELWDTSDDE